MQLHSVLQLAVDIKYEISLNVRTEDGLTNGAACEVKHLSVNTQKPSGIVWVVFDEPDIGKLTRQENRHRYNAHVQQHWTSILPVNRQFSVGKNAHVIRTQFPLRPASAKTVHRSQGDTCEKIVVDFSGRTQPHIHYVALSRVTTLDGLHIKNFNPNKITVTSEVKEEMARLRAQCVLPQPADIPSGFKVLYLNAQSLHRHIADVRADYRLLEADVIICAETRLQSTDDENTLLLPGFQIPFRNDEPRNSSKMRPPHGMAVYIKANLTQQTYLVNNKSVETTITLANMLENHPLQIIGVYCNPQTNVQTIIDTVKSAMMKNKTNSEYTIIIGDFNIDLSKQTSQVAQLLAFFEKHGFSNVRTNYTTDYRTTIDHIYTNIPENNIRADTHETYYSYHKAVYLQLNSQS